jgi:hypothetical protein
MIKQPEENKKEVELTPHFCGICKAPIRDFEGNVMFHIAIHEAMRRMLREGTKELRL